MDIRITNTCNNNCFYCLEQEYRNKKNFIPSEDILKNTLGDNDRIVSFYGGNPLLHPDLEKIISFFKQKKFVSISILTNSFGLTGEKLKALIKSGLSGIGIYFNTFNEIKHNLINGNGINLKELIKNLYLINKEKLNCKIIIHINKQNIDEIYKDIYILNKKFGINEFEFVNYFPFDRPYIKYKEYLEYDFIENKENIENIFKVIKKLNLKVNFLKFSKDFFGENIEYYDFSKGILSQIGEEDNLRLKEKNPFCYLENRCNMCFIKDNCFIYENQK